MTVPLPRFVALLLICSTVAIAPRPARADDPAIRASKRYFERGQKLFALGRFDDALDEYQKAFDASPLPPILFNIGQCYRNLGAYDQAIFSFKRYLKLEPDAPNKKAVDQLIDELEEKRARGEGKRLVGQQPARPPPPPPPRPPEHKPFYTRWWFWTGVAVIGIAGGAGVYAGTRGGGPPGTDLGNLPGVGQ